MAQYICSVCGLKQGGGDEPVEASKPCPACQAYLDKRKEECGLDQGQASPL